MGILLDLALRATVTTGEGGKSLPSDPTPARANHPEDDRLPNPPAAARRHRALTMLTERPGIHYALVTDADADPEAVILALAIHGRASCELRIPKAKYDPFLLMALIERHWAKPVAA